MRNSSWVCFDCRLGVRRHREYNEAVPCPECGSACKLIGYKTEIPPKTKVKAWEALREHLLTERDEQLERHAQSRVRRRHRLEHAIIEFESLPEHPRRRGLIVQLRRELEEL